MQQRMSSNSPSPAVSTENGRGRPKIARLPSATQLSVHQSKKGHPKLKTHNRSMSHNKLLNKLSTSSSSSAHMVRPNLNRSKSTDGLIKTRLAAQAKRNNRSYTKLSGLQPLTKTVSGQSLKSNKSNSSLKGMHQQSNLIPLSGLKTSGRKGRAILKLNDDYENEEYEDLEGGGGGGVAPSPSELSPETEPTPNSEQIPENEPTPESFHVSDKTGYPYAEPTDLATRIVPESESSLPYVQTVENMDKADEKKNGDDEKDYKKNVFSSESSIPSEIEEKDEKKHPNLGYPSAQSSTDDLVLTNNMYGGSLLLSQSTGLTKKFDIKDKKDPFYKNSVSNQPFMGNHESISGISFHAPVQPQNLAEPVITNKNVIQNNSYQPNQTIFNNLKRTNSQYIKKANDDREKIQDTNGNNFSTFLNSASTDHHNANNIETRTQQRLWLQRENSLMDLSNFDPNGSNLSLNHLMFAHNFNSVTNSGGNGSLSNSYFNQARENMQQQGVFPITPGGFNAAQPLASSMTKLHNNQSETPTNTLAPSISSGVDNSSTANINGLLMMVQNNHHNSIQSRTEFERLNREYLNVRRNSNPVGEGLSRVNQYFLSKEIDIPKTTRKGSPLIYSQSTTTTTTGNTFKEVAKVYQENEITHTLNKLWQDAIVSSLASTLSTNSRANQNPNQALTLQNLLMQSQRPVNPRGGSFNQNYNNIRPPHTPTTRAVKLAAQAKAERG